MLPAENLADMKPSYKVLDPNKSTVNTMNNHMNNPGNNPNQTQGGGILNIDVLSDLLIIVQVDLGLIMILVRIV